MSVDVELELFFLQSSLNGNTASCCCGAVAVAQLQAAFDLILPKKLLLIRGCTLVNLGNCYMSSKCCLIVLSLCES
jgi:hypothetical protein